MKKYLIIFMFSCIFCVTSIYSQIIANHTVVDKYDDIPQQYIDSVKKMWLVVAGESHSAGYRTGLNNLETLNPIYAVNVLESGTPEAATASYLRASRATWGDVSNATGWRYDYGEDDWFTSATAISRTKSGISYCKKNNLKLGAIGFGWCWDPGINFNDYINATSSYIKYCADSINTKVFFTTGTVDGYTGESGYIKHLGYEEIRDSVNAHADWVLFDYADILCYDDDGTPTTISWNGNTYPHITATNLGSGNIGHIGEAGVLRLAKAMWWMLARISGWDGDLPVELTSFTAVSGSNVVLNWQTATEVNNYGFEVERSTVKGEWLKVGFIEGAGNSNSPKEYSFTDNNLTLPSYSYSYRLKQIDLDGSFTYSNEVKVNSDEIAAEFRLEQNYPNPFNPSTTIKFTIPESPLLRQSGSDGGGVRGGLVTLKIFDILGREVITLVNEQKPAGTYSVQWNGTNSAGVQVGSGVYFYQLRTGSGFIETKKMLLIK